MKTEKKKEDPSWRGIKNGALGVAIRMRLHALVDGMDVMAVPESDSEKKRRGEIAALIECFRDVQEDMGR